MKRAIFAALFFLGANVFAGDVLWIAETVPAAESAKPNPSLAAFANDVAKGIGISNLELREEKKRDLVVGKVEVAKFKSDNVVTIECLSQDATRYHVKLTIADSTGAILTTEVHLAQRAPILIHGPSEKGEHLVFLLEVR